MTDPTNLSLLVREITRLRGLSHDYVIAAIEMLDAISHERKPVMPDNCDYRVWRKFMDAYREVCQ